MFESLETILCKRSTIGVVIFRLYLTNLSFLWL